MAQGKADHAGDSSAASSWCSGGDHPQRQSKWLQDTLSDLETKKRKMVNLMQVEGDSFTQRVDSFYNTSRPQLLQLLHDLHQSYRRLALTYQSSSSAAAAPPPPPPPPPPPAPEVAAREKVGRMLEEHVKQQRELVRRNEEKRDIIKRLSTRIESLVEENNALKMKLMMASQSHDCSNSTSGEQLIMNHSSSSPSSCIPRGFIKSLNCIGNTSTTTQI